MMLKWIQSIGQGGNPKAVEQAEERKGRKDAKLLDVAHEALAERAARDHATLEALSRLGMPLIERKRLRERVRRKVWDAVKGEGLFEDAELVEEITERLADVAEVDPYYQKMFAAEK